MLPFCLGWRGGPLSSCSHPVGRGSAPAASRRAPRKLLGPLAKQRLYPGLWRPPGSAAIGSMLARWQGAAPRGKASKL